MSEAAARPRATDATVTSGAVLRLAGISRRFRQGEAWLEVLRGVDLELAPGAVIGIAAASVVSRVASSILTMLESPAEPKGIPAAIQRRSVAYSGRSAEIRTPPPWGMPPLAFKSKRLCSGAAGKTRLPRPSTVSGHLRRRM